jgi:excisionase family DNA binding protein
MLTINQAAEQLACSLKSAYRLFHKGELAGYRIGRAYRINEESIASYKERHSAPRPSAVAVVKVAEKRKRGRPRKMMWGT